MPRITHLSLSKKPRKGSLPDQVLQTLLEAPGTFYQVCERIGVDLEQPGVTPRMREIFGNLMLSFIKLDNITYSLTVTARQALQVKPGDATGSIAAPHYRGPSVALPVTVVRRPGANQTMEVA